MSIVTKQVRERPWFPHRILAMAERSNEGRLHSPTFEFFAYAKGKEPHGLARITKLLDRLASEGQIRNKEHFKSLEGWEPLFEFRDVARGCRLICFQAPNGDWITTNGAIKKKWKFNDSDLKTATDMMNRYKAAFSSGHVTHETNPK